MVFLGKWHWRGQECHVVPASTHREQWGLERAWERIECHPYPHCTHFTEEEIEAKDREDVCPMSPHPCLLMSPLLWNMPLIDLRLPFMHKASATPLNITSKGENLAHQEYFKPLDSRWYLIVLLHSAWPMLDTQWASNTALLKPHLQEKAGT